MIFNTGETSEQLREKYNPEGSTLRKCQLRMLDMLMYLDKVCREIGVDYCLESGNILGSLRHGGFIPWDDDIDIHVSRKDYKKLCKYLKDNPHEQYVLQDEYTDEGFIVSNWAVLRDLKSEYIQDTQLHNIRKFKGLQIDIFVIDNGIIPCLYTFMQKVSTVRYRCIDKGYLKAARCINALSKYILIPLCRIIGSIFGNKNLLMYECGYGFKYRRIHKDILLPHKEIFFEGYNFLGPADPKKYCELIYGDYMKIPPIEKRDHHQARYNIWD
jgi:lipopolysaccharide cholinephosphotransferase